jgi:succinate dehydrogenase / fumarate reductase membrane anchor subunit
MGYRTDLSRARGLGPAKHGASHWLAERISAIALAPLSIWAIFAALRLAGEPYRVAVAWLSQPLNAVLLVLLMAKSALLLLNLFVCVLGGTVAIFSILKVALGGGAY